MAFNLDFNSELTNKKQHLDGDLDGLKSLKLCVIFRYLIYLDSVYVVWLYLSHSGVPNLPNNFFLIQCSYTLISVHKYVAYFTPPISLVL